MARTRQRQKNSNTTRASHLEKLRYLSKRGIQADPTNARSVARKYFEARDNPKSYKYRDHKRIPEDMRRPVTPTQAKEFRAHGFRVSGTDVIVDGPRDSRRNPIKGARVTTERGGVVKISTGQRRDFIYGFTSREKKDFAKDPSGAEKRILKRLRDRFPSLAKSRKPQVRLQWGAYQATKDFAPSYFTAKYFAAVSPEEIRRVGKKKARPRADKLTGLHVVIHVTGEKSKRVKRRKK